MKFLFFLLCILIVYLFSGLLVFVEFDVKFGVAFKVISYAQFLDVVLCS